MLAIATDGFWVPPIGSSGGGGGHPFIPDPVQVTSLVPQTEVGEELVPTTTMTVTCED